MAVPSAAKPPRPPGAFGTNTTDLDNIPRSRTAQRLAAKAWEVGPSHPHDFFRAHRAKRPSDGKFRSDMQYGFGKAARKHDKIVERLEEDQRLFLLQERARKEEAQQINAARQRAVFRTKCVVNAAYRRSVTPQPSVSRGWSGSSASSNARFWTTIQRTPEEKENELPVVPQRRAASAQGYSEREPGFLPSLNGSEEGELRRARRGSNPANGFMSRVQAIETNRDLDSFEQRLEYIQSMSVNERLQLRMEGLRSNDGPSPGAPRPQSVPNLVLEHTPLGNSSRGNAAPRSKTPGL